LTPVLVFTRTFGVAVHNPMALLPPAVIAAIFLSCGEREVQRARAFLKL